MVRGCSLMNEKIIRELAGEVNMLRQKLQNLYQEYEGVAQKLESQIKLFGESLTRSVKELEQDAATISQGLVNTKNKYFTALETRYTLGEIDEYEYKVQHEKFSQLIQKCLQNIEEMKSSILGLVGKHGEPRAEKISIQTVVLKEPTQTLNEKKSLIQN